ncbi:MAG: hypothetical protein ACLR8P_13940 [Clostridium fessum]
MYCNRYGTDASGYEVLTAAIRELLNQYPGLPQGERIKFEELEKDKGIASFSGQRCLDL